MPRIGMMVRKKTRAAEKTRKHYIAAGSIRRARSQQVRRHDSEQRAQFENIPSLAPQYGNAGLFSRKGIALPGNGLDQRRFAAAVRPQDAHVFSARNLQVEVAQGLTLTTHYRHMGKRKQWRRDAVHSELKGMACFVVTSIDDSQS